MGCAISKSSGDNLEEEEKIETAQEETIPDALRACRGRHKNEKDRIHGIHHGSTIMQGYAAWACASVQISLLYKAA